MDNVQIQPSRTQLERNLRLSVLVRVMQCAFAFDVPVIVLVWQKSGLTMSEIMLLQAIFSVILAAVELPSGYVADLWGRSRALMVGGATLFVGATAYIYADSFAGYLVAEAFLGVGLAFVSGADQALFYDSLIALNRQEESTRLWGRVVSIGSCFVAAAGMVGGVVASHDVRTPLLLTWLAIGVCFAATFLLTEPPRVSTNPRGGSLQDLFGVAIQHMVHDGRTRWLMIYPAVILGLTQAGLWLYQPYFQVSGVPVVYFGVIFALFNIVAAVSARTAHAVSHRVRQIGVTILPLACVVISYALLGSIVVVAGFAFIFIQQWVRGFAGVVFPDALNRCIASERRATVISLQSMIQRLLYAATIVPVGYFADSHGTAASMLLLSVVALVLGVITLTLYRRAEQI